MPKRPPKIPDASAANGKTTAGSDLILLSATISYKWKLRNHVSNFYDVIRVIYKLNNYDKKK